MAGGRCAPRSAAVQCEASGEWALRNFGGSELGDARRSRRLVALAAALAENPHMSLPKQLPDWSDLTGAYRLLSNARVDPQAILAPHAGLTRREAAGHPVVLCVQDDTQLDFTLRTRVRGLGITGDGGGRGLLQHGALAVLPDKRVLGVLDVAWHALEPVPEGETRRERQGRWTQRFVWHEAAARIGAWPAGSRLVHVGDRHCDLFRFMHEARVLGHDFVVRAMHDRQVDAGQEPLWSKLSRQGAWGAISVTLGTQRHKGNRIKRPGREAVLTLRSAPVVVPPAANDPRTAQAAALPLYAVYLQEERPPEGAEAVEWMLLSSLPVATLEEARHVVGYYTCRWVIEEWHRCLKEGCRVEASQLDEAGDLQRLGAIQCVLAVRLLQMRDQADGACADTPAALAARVPPLWIALVARLAKLDPARLTPRQFYLAVAKRGGYLARKNDPRPGWKVLWRGWCDVVQMVRGAELYAQLLQERERSV